TLEYSSVSISAIKGEIGGAAGSLLDAVAGKLKKHYRIDSNALYGRLARLFGVVDQGEADLNVPAYNGGLFISKPRAGDDSAEAAAARFLAENKIPTHFSRKPSTCWLATKTPRLINSFPSISSRSASASSARFTKACSNSGSVS